MTSLSQIITPDTKIKYLQMQERFALWPAPFKESEFTVSTGPKFGNLLQGKPTGNQGDEHRDSTEGDHPGGMMVVADDFSVTRSQQDGPQREWQNQSVQRPDDDQDGDRFADEGENNSGKQDEGDDNPIVVGHDRPMERPQEGYARVSAANDGSQGRRKEDDPEHFVPDVPKGDLEYGGGRVLLVELMTGGHDTQYGQEQDDAHHARGQNPQVGGPADEGDVFFPRDPSVDQAVAARECDISPDRSPYESDHGQEQGAVMIRGYCFDECVACRRTCRNHHVTYHHQHDDPQELGDDVHGFPRVFQTKDNDRENACDDRSRDGGNAEQDVQPQARTGYIPNIEGEAADHDQDGDERPETWKDHVGHILASLPRYRQDAPDIELRPDVNNQRGQDRKSKVGRKLFSENGGLGQECGPDGGGRHKENGPPQQPSAYSRPEI